MDSCLSCLSVCPSVCLRLKISWPAAKDRRTTTSEMAIWFLYVHMEAASCSSGLFFCPFIYYPVCVFFFFFFFPSSSCYCSFLKLLSMQHGIPRIYQLWYYTCSIKVSFSFSSSFFYFAYFKPIIRPRAAEWQGESNSQEKWYIRVELVTVVRAMLYTLHGYRYTRTYTANSYSHIQSYSIHIWYSFFHWCI